MLRSLLILCAVLYGINSVSANARRRRSVYRVGPARDPREGKDPSVVLQLSPGFFDYPGLKDIYAALTADRKSQDGLYLQLAPRKREAENPLRNNEAAFAIRINPVVPRNPLSVKKFNTTSCDEKKIDWCVELPATTPQLCSPIDTPTPIPTTCGPSKPTGSVHTYAYCNLDRSIIPVPKDLCDECEPPVKTSTPYIACYSMPPPTVLQRLKYCNPTTATCHMIPCTYKTADPASSRSPPTPPPCDVPAALLDRGDPGRKEVSELKEPAKYYILVKRSPGGWRRKRSQLQKRRFRIVPQLER